MKENIERYNWIIDCLDSILTSPRWEAEVLSYVDEKCIIFDDEDENQLQYTTIHNEFIDLVDSVLRERLLEYNITEDELNEACIKYNSIYKQSKLDGTVMNQIHAMAEFREFKTMMLKRNLELQIEALEALTDTNNNYNQIPGNLKFEEDSDKVKNVSAIYLSSEGTHNSIQQDMSQERKVLNQVRTEDNLVDRNDANDIHNEKTDKISGNQPQKKDIGEHPNILTAKIPNMKNLSVVTKNLVELTEESSICPLIDDTLETICSTNTEIPKLLPITSTAKAIVNYSVSNCDTNTKTYEAMERHNEFMKAKLKKLKQNNQNVMERKRREEHLRKQRDLIIINRNNIKKKSFISSKVRVHKIS